MSSGAVTVRPDLVDLLMDLYCDWRTECAEVQAAYERFSLAPAADRDLAFGGYLAALDREESAGDAYAEQLRLITSHIGAESRALFSHSSSTCR